MSREEELWEIQFLHLKFFVSFNLHVVIYLCSNSFLSLLTFGIQVLKSYMKNDQIRIFFIMVLGRSLGSGQKDLRIQLSTNIIRNWWHSDTAGRVMAS